MKTEMKIKRTLFLKRTYLELMEMFEMYGATYSTASVKYMKLIVKRMQYEIHLAEMEKIRKEVENGKLTPKEAVKKKAASRKRYRG